MCTMHACMVYAHHATAGWGVRASLAWQWDWLSVKGASYGVIRLASMDCRLGFPYNKNLVNLGACNLRSWFSEWVSGQATPDEWTIILALLNHTATYLFTVCWSCLQFVESCLQFVESCLQFVYLKTPHKKWKYNSHSGSITLPTQKPLYQTIY